MRRVAGCVCLFLGALVLMVGVLAKPVLYHNLAKVPLDQKTTLISIGKNMSALEVSSAGVRVLKDATLQNTKYVVGIPGKAIGNNAFWQYLVASKEVGGKDLDFSSDGVSIDRFTGEATNCCGDYKSVGTLQHPSAQVPVTHKGLFFKLPFDTKKTTYQWWDTDLGRTEPMKFLRTQTVQGVPTYVFQQVTGPVVYGPKQTGVPGELFGSKTPVDADQVYQNTRTLYVEPNTGLIIKGVEEQNKRLEAPGFAAVPITKGTIGYTDATVRANVADLGSKGTMLGFLNGPMTWTGILIGLLVMGLGAFLVLGGSKDKAVAAGGHRNARDRSLLSPK